MFDATLAAKPQLVAATKMDAVVDDTLVGPLEAKARSLGLPFFQISAVAGDGLDVLLEAVWKVLAEAREAEAAARVAAPPTLPSDPAMLTSRE